MRVLTCKMCGGALEVDPTLSVGECPYCGSITTFPTATDDAVLGLHSLAEEYRRQCDFDKALETYNSILLKKKDDPEAYWGALLSSFGIEYVIDPVTQKRIPTCHRVQETPLEETIYFSEAVRYANDDNTRNAYLLEGKRIAELQQQILSISANEQPFDIFISYKETEDGGSRTSDSILAQDLYELLSDKGFKVFFSRITLENKLGSAYEPIIFSALRSSKVMLVISTSPEHINAVWVRNEWSRFLQLMMQDKGKVLIPCYLGMDPYQLPEELRSLQSQDMSKIGYQQDLLRGIEKVVDTRNSQAQNLHKNIVEIKGIQAVEGEIKLLLEEGNFQVSDELCDKILDYSTTYAPAYYYKMMVELRLKDENAVLGYEPGITSNINFVKALAFATGDYKTYLLNLDEKAKTTRHNYQQANHLSMKGNYAEAAIVFASLGNYLDSHEQSETCRDNAYNAACHFKRTRNFSKAAKLFKQLGDYNDSELLGTECEEKAKRNSLILRCGMPVVSGIIVIFLVYIYQTRFNWRRYYDNYKLAVAQEMGDSIKELYLKQLDDIAVQNLMSPPSKIRALKDATLLWQELSQLEKKGESGDANAFYEAAQKLQSLNLEAMHKKYSLALYEKAALMGNRESLEYLATGYEKGEPSDLFKHDDFQAARWSVLAGLQGNSELASRGYGYFQKDNTKDGLLFKALCIAMGVGCTSNQTEAFQCFIMGDSSPSQQLKYDYRKIHWNLLLQLSENSTAVRHYVSRCYQSGNFIEHDLRKAFENCQKAAEKQFPFAQFDLGIYYKEGEQVPADSEQANKLFSQAVVNLQNLSQDYIIASCYLGIAYQNGWGVRQDIQKAINHYERAKIFSDAAIPLGNLYISTHKFNHKAAFNLFKNISKTGNPVATERLAFCYECGIGVKKDIITAYRLYERAASTGYYLAQLKCHLILASIYGRGIFARGASLGDNGNHKRPYFDGMVEKKLHKSHYETVFPKPFFMLEKDVKELSEHWRQLADENSTPFANQQIPDALYTKAMCLRNKPTIGTTTMKPVLANMREAAKRNCLEAMYYLAVRDYSSSSDNVDPNQTYLDKLLAINFPPAVAVKVRQLPQERVGSDYSKIKQNDGPKWIARAIELDIVEGMAFLRWCDCSFAYKLKIGYQLFASVSDKLNRIFKGHNDEKIIYIQYVARHDIGSSDYRGYPHVAEIKQCVEYLNYLLEELGKNEDKNNVKLLLQKVKSWGLPVEKTQKGYPKMKQKKLKYEYHTIWKIAFSQFLK